MVRVCLGGGNRDEPRPDQPQQPFAVDLDSTARPARPLWSWFAMQEANEHQPDEWLSRVLEAAQAATEGTGSTACEIIAYLGAVPPAHLLPATPMLSAVTPSAHIARSPRSSLLAERVAQLKQSVHPHSTKAPHKGSGPRPSITPTTARRSAPPTGSEGSAPPANSLFEGAGHRYHRQLVEATMQHNQTRAARVARPQASSSVDELGLSLELRELRATCERQQATLRQHEATIIRLHRMRFAEVEEAHVTQRHAEVARVGNTHTVASLRAELAESRDECRRLRSMLGEGMASYVPTRVPARHHPQRAANKPSPAVSAASPVSHPTQFWEAPPARAEAQHAEEMREMLERFEEQATVQVQQHKDEQAHMRLVAKLAEGNSRHVRL